MNNMNYIIAEIDINENNINKNIRIINSYEISKKQFDLNNGVDDSKYENEKEIKEKCKIKINNKIIEFSYFYKFNKEGKYIIKYSFTNNLT